MDHHDVPPTREVAYNRALLIQKWQKAARPEDDEPDERSLVSRLCEGCCGLYREIVRHLSKNDAFSNEILINLKRSYDHLRLWDDAYKVSDGSLDETLGKSSTVSRATARILTNIAGILTESTSPVLFQATRPTLPGFADRVSGLVLLSSSEKLAELAVELRQTTEHGSYGDDFGDESSDDAASDCSSLTESRDIREISRDLSTATDCLMDLEPLYKDPVFDVEPKVSVEQSMLADWKPEQAYCDRIAQRFSQTEEELVSRLGKANFQRYLRCKEKRDTAGQEVPTGEETTPFLGDRGAATIAPSSKFHDSGIGSSLPTLSYAETVMSYGQGEGTSIRIPPLPEEAKRGSPFECVACGQRITALTNSAWK
ncbi:hypothetical protein DL767_000565 [Monosporascus sp. MG133]|nr:hypothetical protein DL767_000565 [Monosporascus sp. MG133]